MSPQVRTIHDDELPAYLHVVNTAMLSPPASPEAIEERRQYFDLDRCLGSYDATGRMRGVARSFATELTVPGGAVPAAAVSAVGVLPTHRRQGHLSGLMRAQLDDVRDRGEPVAVLIAAEFPIYGRYGYGPATHACGVRIDADASWRDPASGSIELAANEDVAKAATAIYDRARRQIPGHISWGDDYWDWHTGGWPASEDGPSRRDAPKAIWYDAEGEAQGVAIYTVRGDWIDNRPEGELSASVLLAATPEAERGLLRFLTSVDWISSVRVGLRPVDDPAPLWLVDGRAATLVDHSDHVWARLVDVAAALTARHYAVDGSVVLDVVDPGGYAGGRVALEGGPGGATCTPTTRSADLTVPATALGAAYLGGTPWTRLAAAGWVDEHTPGAAERARALFTPSRSPWCSTGF
jgi:predicted acetyltransferase